ncbi:hypothetical protein BWI17_03725 [Betaproteobacteria bacterium GR16-43]|nr:hypothetical protein BWI17_03725 [Betaproteobacteria bacterium GR16-43]
MSASDEWEMFRSYADQGSAEVMCSWLLREDVPAKVETRSLENGREGQYCVFVHRSLVHRARWVVAQLPPSDEELEFLATGQLPGPKAS